MSGRAVKGVGDVRIVTYEGGDRSGPPVVLLHGLTATHRYVVMGSRVLQRGGHRVLAYDARAHGRSAPADAPGAYGYQHLAGDLRAVLDAHRTRRAVLAGASMGAHTAVRFALEHPDRVAGLVVITPAYHPDSYAGPERLARWDALAEGFERAGVEGFLAAYGDPPVPDKWKETVLTVMRQRLSLHTHPEALADAIRVVPRSQPFRSMEDLQAVAVPATIVASRDEVDPGHPLEVGEAYAAAIPGAQLVVDRPGKSPLAWQGAQVSHLIASVVERARRTQDFRHDA
jgi:pimeloyl-ACP methyl ester carboxylesterase